MLLILLFFFIYAHCTHWTKQKIELLFPFCWERLSKKEEKDDVAYSDNIDKKHPSLGEAEADETNVTSTDGKLDEDRDSLILSATRLKD